MPEGIETVECKITGEPPYGGEAGSYVCQITGLPQRTLDKLVLPENGGIILCNGTVSFHTSFQPDIQRLLKEAIHAITQAHGEQIPALEREFVAAR